MTRDRTIGVALPTWMGDAIMATPALRRVRTALPDARIVGMGPPLAVELLRGLTTDDGAPVFDALEAGKPRRLMGPVRTGRALRTHKLDDIMLLPNSLAWGAAAWFSGARRRIGYARDGRGPLLTDGIRAPRTRRGGRPAWACVPAVTYYWHAAGVLLGEADRSGPVAPRLVDPERVELDLPAGEVMSLPVRTADGDAADAVIRSALGSDGSDRPIAVLNPGGNNPAKRWPAERFGELARWLGERGIAVLVNGSPAEAGVCDAVAAASNGSAIALPAVTADAANRAGAAGDRFFGLRAVVGLLQRASLLVTNDTGPRHAAAAVGCPVVSLFGPTDPRWTTIPVRALTDGSPSERILVADPTLPAGELSNDHPERCAIGRIETAAVVAAAGALLDGSA